MNVASAFKDRIRLGKDYLYFFLIIRDQSKFNHIYYLRNIIHILIRKVLGSNFLDIYSSMCFIYSGFSLEYCAAQGQHLYLKTLAKK